MTPENVLSVINQFGVTIGLLILIAIGVMRLISVEIPKFAESWRSSRKKAQDHKLSMELDLVNQQQEELSKSYDFIRGSSYNKLVDITNVLWELVDEVAALNNKVSTLITVMTTIYDNERSSGQRNTARPDPGERAGPVKRNNTPRATATYPTDSHKQPDAT